MTREGAADVIIKFEAPLAVLLPPQIGRVTSHPNPICFTKVSCEHLPSIVNRPSVRGMSDL
jgi:hypothetical protein